MNAGTRLGSYEILAPLGAGGMGDVYRARDTRLGRDVAIEMLPSVFALDAERVARFEREARILALLNHPHIAHIYGLEGVDGGQGQSIPFIVMEPLTRCRPGPVDPSGVLTLSVRGDTVALHKMS